MSGLIEYTTESLDLNFSIEERPGRGRCAIAKRDFSPGDLVLIEEPYAFTVTDVYREIVCSFCGKFCIDAKVYTISSSDTNRYCSESCISKDYPIHSLEIEAASKLASIGIQGKGITTCHLVARVAATRKYENASGALKAKIGKIKSHPSLGRSNIFIEVKKLEAANSWISPENKAAISETSAAVAAVCAQCKLPMTVADTEHMIYAIHSNAHQITDSQGRRLGVGLFPTTSMLNHSCVPNCAHYFLVPEDDKKLVYQEVTERASSSGVSDESLSQNKNLPPKLVMRATKHIKAGEELCYSYVQLYQSTSSRRQQISSTYSFLCDCLRCTQGGLVELQWIPGTEAVVTNSIGKNNLDSEDKGNINILGDHLIGDSSSNKEAVASAFLNETLDKIYSSDSLREPSDMLSRLVKELSDERVLLMDPFHLTMFRYYSAISNVASQILESTNGSRELMSNDDIQSAIAFSLLLLGAINQFTRTRQIETAKIALTIARLMKFYGERIISSDEYMNGIDIDIDVDFNMQSWREHFIDKVVKLVHGGRGQEAAGEDQTKNIGEWFQGFVWRADDRVRNSIAVACLFIDTSRLYDSSQNVEDRKTETEILPTTLLVNRTNGLGSKYGVIQAAFLSLYRDTCRICRGEDVLNC